MAIIDLKDLKTHLLPKDKLLGFDHGKKTIGLAVADPKLTIASAIETIQRKKWAHDLQRIRDITQEYQIGAFVIGLPLNMDGTEGPRCQSVRDFAKTLMSVSEEQFGRDIPIVFWDERLSTHAVETFLIDDFDMTRKRRKEVVDKLAAAHILQGALDHLHRMENEADDADA